MEITFPVYKNEDKGHDCRTIDGLSFLSDDLVGESRSQSFVGATVTLKCPGEARLGPSG